MFPTCKQILNLHLSRKIIPTTADHPFYVPGKGWTEAADLRPSDPLLLHDGQHVPVEGVTDSGDQETVYSLNPGEQAMPDQPNNKAGKPIIGFAADTPLLTPEGYKPIEDLRPGDFIQSGPDGEQPDDDHDEPEPPRWWERN